MIQDRINEEYFEWLYDIVCKDLYSDRVSYRDLLIYLHNVEFRYIHPRDENRASDGIGMRYRFSISQNYH